LVQLLVSVRGVPPVPQRVLLWVVPLVPQPVNISKTVANTGH
jgi:hypothetical protein